MSLRNGRLTSGAARGRGGFFQGLAVLAIAGTALVGCAVMEERVAARGGEAHSEGGIGGTGIETVGLIGSVTGFGSVLVNGLAVDIEANLPVDSALGPVVGADLAVGDMVALVAAEGEDGFRAVEASELHVLVGPITADGPGALAVMGAPVATPAGAPIVDDTGAAFPIEALRKGDRLAVSGLWRGERVVASRIERLSGAAPTLDSVAGVLRADGGGGLKLGGAALRLSGGEAASARTGAFARAVGRYGEGALMVKRLEPGAPALLTASPRERVSIEGFASVAGGAPQVDGLGVAFDEAARLAPVGEGRAIFIGAVAPTESGPVFVVRHGVRLPDDLDGRRRALSGLGDAFAPAGALELREP